MFSFYIDPARIDPQDFLPAEMSRFSQACVKSTKPIDPKAPVLLPGEPAARMRAERLDQWRSVAGRHIQCVDCDGARCRRHRSKPSARLLDAMQRDALARSFWFIADTWKKLTNGLKRCRI